MTNPLETFTLRFSRPPDPELIRLIVSRDGVPAHIAVRGKSEGSYRGSATFQWTTAVKALALLFVRTKTFGNQDAALVGERRSLAAALDFAVGKPPRWLLDFFGPEGSSPARLFRRSNPELKQSGPVAISFSPWRITASNIRIEVEGVSVEEDAELRALCDSFSEGQLVPNPAEPRIKEAGETFSALYAKIFREEAQSSLSRVKVTSEGWCSAQLQLLVRDPLFRRLTHTPEKSVAPLAPPLASRMRLGVASTEQAAEIFPDGLKIYCAICQPGLIAIATYLREYLHVPIILDPYHLYGPELVRHAMAERDSNIPTVVVSGLGPSSPFFNEPKHGYFPFMVGPALAHRVLLHGQRAQQQRAEELHFVLQEPTSALFSFEGLRRYGSCPGYRKLCHVEPDEVMELAAGGNSFASLLWFPHNRLLPYFTDSIHLGAASSDPYVDFTLIFGNEKLYRSTNQLEYVQAMFRHAWLSLLENPDRLAVIASKLVSDETFMTYVRRALGLHHLGSGANAKFSSKVPELVSRRACAA